MDSNGLKHSAAPPCEADPPAEWPRKKAKSAEGSEHKTCRVERENGVFASAQENTSGRVADSHVHHMLCFGGFMRSRAEEEDLKNNELTRKALEKLCKATDKTNNAARSQACFECFVLKHSHENEHGKWLVDLVEWFDDAGKLKDDSCENLPAFKLPTDMDIMSWIENLCEKRPDEDDEAAPSLPGEPKGRGCSAKTIETYLSGLSTTTKLCGNPRQYNKIFKETIDEISEGDVARKAPKFNVTETLPILHKALFHPDSKIQWPHAKRVEVWTAFLAEGNLIGWASDCMKYCPVLENIEEPPEHEFDRDGMPPYIYLIMTDWKWRKKKEKGTKWRVLVERNKLNSKCCFIFHYYLLKIIHEESGLSNDNGKMFGVTLNVGGSLVLVVELLSTCLSLLPSIRAMKN